MEKEKKPKSRKNWLHPALSWGLIGSVALLVLAIGLYCFCF